ncbi:hypothetical protein MNBD_GAMMA10-1438 [hydrothermal vent metagenome]|uniref:Uncharacterized protein n=1 Tax=hydrothermal vent metagenome TaxID=652676 RepID=A0A3B0YUU0_9ZZZZ
MTFNSGGSASLDTTLRAYVYARDKGLSTFTDINIGPGIPMNLGRTTCSFLIAAAPASLHYTCMAFDYANFRDIRVKNGAGNEPLYNFTASVIRLYFSFWPVRQ